MANKVQKKIDLFVTKDYASFKNLAGNRGADPNHVNSLIKKLKAEGNLTSEFPVEVNEKKEVIDGQHRIAALQELGWPVYFTVVEGMNLSTVRQINLGRKNWSWKDYASSYASEGKKDYQDLLDFHEAFGQSHHVLMLYANFHIGHSGYSNPYTTGDFKIADRAVMFGLLTQLKELLDCLPIKYPQMLPVALYTIMTNKDYDHKRMINKFTRYGSGLKHWSTAKDYLRAVEDLYNSHQPEGTEVRFF